MPRKHHRLGQLEKSVTKQLLLDRDGVNCWICSKVMALTSRSNGGDSLKSSIDHVDPLGSNDIANLRLAHRVCNMVRDRHPITPLLQEACKMIVEQYWQEVEAMRQ